MESRVKTKAAAIALWGVLGALAVAVSAIEGAFELPILPPGMKPGLANVVTVISAVLSGLGGAFFITAFKALFALLTRGVTAFILSFCGGMLSASVTVLLLKYGKERFSLIGISIAGAFTHNAAQLIAAIIITGTPALLYYAPVLCGFALISGTLTGIIIRTALPYVSNLTRRFKH